jgi:hypothetical protein
MDPARNAAGISPAVYLRHRPEQTLLYQLVEWYSHEFKQLMARLAALAPKPRVHLTRFHGVFAPTASTGLASPRRNGARESRNQPQIRMNALPWSAMRR